MLFDFFSVFDDCFFPHAKTYWVITWFLMWGWSFFFAGSLLSCAFWIKGDLIDWVCDEVNGFTWNAVDEMGGLYISGFGVLINTFVFLLLVITLGELFPYSFFVRGHFVSCFSFGFGVWLSLIVSSFELDYVLGLISVVLRGSPFILTPLITIIEIVSLFVRPIRLTMRLILNIRLGKIILRGAGEACYRMSAGISSLSFSLSSIIPLLLVFSVLVFLLAVETFVGFLQSYIYLILLCSYAKEHKE